MTKCRVYKRQDGSAMLFWVNQKKFIEDDSHEDVDPYANKMPDLYQGLSFKFIEDTHPILVGLEEDRHLSHLDTSKRTVDKLYFDGELHADNLKIDTNWEVLLMPVQIIKGKHLAKINQDIDAELAKETPDSILVAKKQRELEKAKAYPDPSWYQIALANLDAKVAKGEPDKPVIRQKLQAKIDALRVGAPDMNVGEIKND